LKDKVQYNDIDPAILDDDDDDDDIDIDIDIENPKNKKEIELINEKIEAANEFEEIGDLHDLSIKLPSSEILYDMVSNLEKDILDRDKET
jgi:hypothetical protein